MTVQYINFFSVLIVAFFLSVFVGRKNPLFMAIFYTLFLALIGYFLNEFKLSLVYYLIFGFIICFLWSIFFRWLTLKDQMGPNDTKLNFLIGFGTRNTRIISNKNSRTLDWELNHNQSFHRTGGAESLFPSGS